MYNSPIEYNSNLIEVKHVGVTANMEFPLKSHKIRYSSSIDSEDNNILNSSSQNSHTAYNQFAKETTNGLDTTGTENSKILYEMKSVSSVIPRSKISIKLHTKPKKSLYKSKVNKKKQNKNPKRNPFEDKAQNKTKFDYLIKPLLTVIFNGFLHPLLIFCLNIFSMLRDILEPIADIINNFMKPVATVGRSIRLIHVTNNTKNLAKIV